MSRDVAQEVTDQILSALDRGVVPWRKPWTAIGGQRNAQSGRPYRGINQILTDSRASAEGWSDPRWTTYKAAKKAGGQVRKGERGQLVTFWKRLQVDDKDNPGEKRVIPLLRSYVVFNVDQVDGLDLPELEKPEPVDPIVAGEEMIVGMPNPPQIDNVAGSDSAFYAPVLDQIVLPERDAFESADAYYHVAAHEMTHSTGHASRLNRPEVAEANAAFGSADYGREELVAELGAAMLCGTVGIQPRIDQAASYIAGWRRALTDDPKLILQAAGKAQKAADYILGVTFTD